MTLPDNISVAPRMASVWVATIGAALASVWAGLPEPLQLALVAKLGFTGIGASVALTFVGTIVARLVKQESISGPANPPAFAPTEAALRFPPLDVDLRG